METYKRNEKEEREEEKEDEIRGNGVCSWKNTQRKGKKRKMKEG